MHALPRNLIILILSQMISTTGSIVIVTLGGIIGSTLATNKAWATLPMSAAVVAIAATTIPATILMRHIGRSKGFAIGSLSAIVALLVAIVALWQESFGLFVVAAALFGINMAFTQQYRYAAAESVSTQRVPTAISFVLFGAIGGAVLGSELVMHGHTLIQRVPYAATLTALVVLYLVQAIMLMALEPARAATNAQTPDAVRPLGVMAMQPLFVTAVLGGMAAYGLMTLIMTATPISMHVHDGYSIEQTAAVIRAHVLAMYLPSLISGILIRWFGVVRLMFTGALALFAASIVGLEGQTVMHYFWTLALLGIGWNFLYVGGTTMLTYTYTAAERFRAQAVNEFSVFGSSAVASLLAGSVLYFFGWHTLMILPVPVLVVVCVSVLLVRHNERLLVA